MQIFVKFLVTVELLFHSDYFCDEKRDVYFYQLNLLYIFCISIEHFNSLKTKHVETKGIFKGKEPKTIRNANTRQAEVKILAMMEV